MITIFTILLVVFGSCALISLSIYKSTKSEKLTLVGFIVTLITIPFIGGSFINPIIEEKQSSAIIKWCNSNKIEYISHYKVKQTGRGNPFGVNYRVIAKGYDIEIAVKAGDWLTGSFGWNIKQSL
jgi:hypothetical protein